MLFYDEDPFLDILLIDLIFCKYGHDPDEYEAFAAAVGVTPDEFENLRVGMLTIKQLKSLCLRMWLSADEILGLSADEMLLKS